MATVRYHGTVCKTCRRRGKKCDKRLPECSTCLSKGIQCEGYALRWAGVASRGKLAGKNIPVSDAPASKGAQRKSAKGETTRGHSNLPSTQQQAWGPAQSTEPEPESERAVGIDWDFPTPVVIAASELFDVNGLFDFDPSILESGVLPLLHFDLPELEDALAVVPVPKSTIMRPLDVFNVPSEMRFVLDYYISEVAPRLCVDNNSLTNPYIEYILPLAVEVPSLLYACAALAACQFDIRLGNVDFHLQSLKLKGKAMNRLKEALYSNERAKDEGTLATVLMLSLCDIALGGFAGFHTHFAGAKRLIDMRQSQRTTQNFVEQNLAWLDTMSATSHFRKPTFSADDIASYVGSSEASGKGEWSYDVFPCPVDHFEIIHQIVELYKSQPDPNSPSAEVLGKVASYKNLVLTRPMQLHRGEFWLHLTEAYRFAIVLYLIRLFHCGDDQDEIAWLARSVFFHARSTVPSTGWADQLLWPLFHAALEIKDETIKNWLRERAAAMQISGGFRNVESAMAILEDVWAGKSSRNYMDLMAGEGTSSILLV